MARTRMLLVAVGLLCCCAFPASACDTDPCLPKVVTRAAPECETDPCRSSRALMAALAPRAERAAPVARPWARALRRVGIAR